MEVNKKTPSWGALLPDAELLKQWQGVEEGLRQRRRLSGIGLAGAMLGAVVQVLALLEDQKTRDFLRNLMSFDFSAAFHSPPQNWYIALPLVVAVLSFIFYGWSRFWLNESEQAFRYTCSIDEFAPAASGPPLMRSSHGWRMT